MDKIKNALTDKMLWILLSLACIVRLYVWYVTPVLAKDGISYINIAKHFINGNFAGGLTHPYHPLYPLFISLGSVANLEHELSGRIISLLFSILSILTVYIFSKRLFNPQLAFITALLIAFHPYSVRLSVDVRSESLYFFFYMLGFCLGYAALTTKESYLFLLTGTTSALAYLTRPEGVSIIVILSAWIAVHSIRDFKKPHWYVGPRNLCLLLIGFLIFSCPYLLYLKHHTHSWTLTQKKQLSKISGINILLNDKNKVLSKRKCDIPKWETSETLLNAEKDLSSRSGNFNTNSGAYQKNKSAPDTKTRHISIKKYLKPLFKIFNAFADALHYPFLIFLMIGILSAVRNHTHKLINLYILSYIILFLFILYFLKLSSGYASVRHLMNIVLVTIFWTGLGVKNTYDWLIRWQKQPSQNLFSAKGIVFLCLIITLFLPKTLKSFKQESIYIDAGLWIKTFYRDVPIILTDEPRVAFYANTLRLAVPKKMSYDKFIKYAKQKKVKLIIVSEDINTFIPDFFTKIHQSDMKKLIELSAKEKKVIIYETLY